MASLMLAAALASSTDASAYVSGDGHEYDLQCNQDGYELTSKYPVARAVGSGAGTHYRTGRETIYLGQSCDAYHRVFGTGGWCWANGGFVANFPDHKFGFPRQELICDPEPNYSDNCRC